MVIKLEMKEIVEELVKEDVMKTFALLHLLNPKKCDRITLMNALLPFMIIIDA